MSKERSSGHKGPGTRHTPGPWSFERYDDKRFVVNSDAAQWSPVASCEANRIGSREVSRAEAEANARLIAAAPDLLEACESLLAFYELERPGGTHNFAIAARAAIAKATPTT